MRIGSVRDLLPFRFKWGRRRRLCLDMKSPRSTSRAVPGGYFILRTRSTPVNHTLPQLYEFERRQSRCSPFSYWCFGVVRSEIARLMVALDELFLLL